MYPFFNTNIFTFIYLKNYPNKLYPYIDVIWCVPSPNIPFSVLFVDLSCSAQIYHFNTSYNCILECVCDCPTTDIGDCRKVAEGEQSGLQRLHMSHVSPQHDLVAMFFLVESKASLWLKCSRGCFWWYHWAWGWRLVVSFRDWMVAFQSEWLQAMAIQRKMSQRPQTNQQSVINQ